MKFALRYCNTGRYANPADAVELLQAAEEAGFESAWTVEHTVVPEGYESAYPYSPDGKMAGGRTDIPLPDPLIWLSFAAAATSTIKLGTAILILPQHNPVIVAKQVGDARPSVRRPCAPRRRRRLAARRVRGARRFVRGSRRAHGRVHRRDARAMDRRAPVVPRRVRPLRRSPLPPAPGQRHGADHSRRPFEGGGQTRRPARRRVLPGARGAPAALFDLARRTAEEAGRDPPPRSSCRRACPRTCRSCQSWPRRASGASLSRSRRWPECRRRSRTPRKHSDGRIVSPTWPASESPRLRLASSRAPGQAARGRPERPGSRSPPRPAVLQTHGPALYFGRHRRRPPDPGRIHACSYRRPSPRMRAAAAR